MCIFFLGLFASVFQALACSYMANLDLRAGWLEKVKHILPNGLFNGGLA